MDFRLPITPDDSHLRCRNLPVRLWMLVALIGTILGLAMAMAGMVTDERDYAHRHGAVLPSQAL